LAKKLKYEEVLKMYSFKRFKVSQAERERENGIKSLKFF